MRKRTKRWGGNLSRSIELLEKRTVLSPLLVNGTAGDDAIIIEIVGSNVQYTVGGIPLMVSDAAVTSIVVDGLGGNDTIQLRSNSDNPVTLSGSAGDDTFHVGSTSSGLAAITAPALVLGNADQDTLNFNDQPSAGNGFVITSSTLSATGANAITYGQMEGAVLNCGGGSDVISVNSLGTTPFQVNGAAGDDDLRIAAETLLLSDVESRVLFAGGDNNDTVTINDSASGANNEFQLANSKIFGYGGPEHAWSQTETATLNTGSGGNMVTIDLSTAGARFTINTNGGGDAVNANISNPNVRAPRVMINTGAEDDSVLLNDAANGFDGDDWTIQSAFVFRNFFDGMDYTNAESLEVRCGNGANRVDVNGVHAGFTTLRGGGGNDDIHVNTTNGNVVSIDGQAGLDNVTVESGATGSLFGSQDLNIVSVKGTGSLLMRFNDPRVTARSLSIDPTAALDVFDGTFILDYTGTSPIADIAADLVTGYNGTGNWAGPGIQSQAWSGFRGVGYAEASELFTTFPAPFAGVNVDNTAILVRFTLSGDANLDRVVDIGDFAHLAANFNVNPSSWVRGDFDYFEGTDISDFSLVALNFNRSYPGASPRLAVGRSVFGNATIDEILAELN